MRQVTVLIVDDHDAVRQALTAALATQPEFVVVGSTGNPQVATDLAWFWEPAIILIDIRRLHGDGSRHCQRIARASPASHLVVFTSYLQAGEEEMCHRLGASTCLVKSIGLQGLLNNLRALLHRREAKRP
ncbi:MAG: response regulator [Dehalococcoidia bacterium]